MIQVSHVGLKGTAPALYIPTLYISTRSAAEVYIYIYYTYTSVFTLYGSTPSMSFVLLCYRIDCSSKSHIERVVFPSQINLTLRLFTIIIACMILFHTYNILFSVISVNKGRILWQLPNSTTHLIECHIYK